MEITYILNSRMPTEKARGLQTVRMCEAFSNQGCDVSLRYSDRAQYEKLSGESVKEFYEVTEDIDIDNIPYLDFHPLIPYIGTTLIKPFLYLGNFLFILYCLYLSIEMSSDYFITRDWIVCVPFVYFGIPTIYSAHTVDAKGFSPRAQLAFSHISEKDGLKLVISNSKGTAEGMAEIGVPEDKIIVEPNGVDLRDYRPELSKQVARENVCLPVDENQLVYTGSLARAKGVYVIADASQHIDGKVVIVGGKKKFVNDLRAYVEKEDLEDVIITGFVKPRNVSTYQFAADALVLPPLEGSFDRKHQSEYTSPIKLFEYMAASRPIIASDIIAIRELLEDEKQALLVNPGDPESFAKAFNRILRDQKLNQMLVKECRENVKDHTWDCRAESIINEIEERYLSE